LLWKEQLTRDSGEPILSPFVSLFIARLNGSLSAAGIRYQAELYTGAMHGFTMSDLPMYNEAACNKHWDRLLALFARTLKSRDDELADENQPHSRGDAS
jgi:Dienelactone hydrolase family